MTATIELRFKLPLQPTYSAHEYRSNHLTQFSTPRTSAAAAAATQTEALSI
jgi:hypothetical protein